MSPIKLVDGEEVEITEAEVQEIQATWEFYRGPADEPLRRKVTPDGTVLENDVPALEEAVASSERAEVAEAATQRVSQNLQTLASSPAPISDSIIEMWVARGLVTVEEALDAGWTPPA